jgi:aryl-alcohol dehydrogenase-like predicted oxidoreductase
MGDRVMALTAPTFILGCGGFGGIGSDRALWTPGDTDHRALLDTAFERGIRWLDTANSYGDGASERTIGDWLAGRGASVREQVVVCTKVGQPTGRHDAARGRDGLLSGQEIRTSVDGSLSRLGVETIDVYLAHHLDVSTSITELLGTMNELVIAGKIRHWGLCNVPAWLVVECARLCGENGWRRPSLVQNGYSLLQQGDRREFSVITSRYSLGYTPHSPLAGGWLAGLYTGGPGVYPSGSRMALRPAPYAHLESEATRSHVAEFARIAGEYGVPPATLAVGWLLSQDFVTAPVIGPASPEELDTTIAAADLRLDAHEVERLADLFGGLAHTSSLQGAPRP